MNKQTRDRAANWTQNARNTLDFLYRELVEERVEKGNADPSVFTALEKLAKADNYILEALVAIEHIQAE